MHGYSYSELIGFRNERQENQRVRGFGRFVLRLPEPRTSISRSACETLHGRLMQRHSITLSFNQPGEGSEVARCIRIAGGLNCRFVEKCDEIGHCLG